MASKIQCPFKNSAQQVNPLVSRILGDTKLKAGTVRQLYYCPDCKSYFSETQNTALAHLKTPISRIVLILQSLNEGQGINAVCRVFEVSKNSIYRWQERLSGLKSTLMLYALCQQFLHRLIEGDELYTQVKKPGT
jgi:transposase-like protein